MGEEPRRPDLRSLERRLTLLVDHVRDYAIFLLNPDGTVASWNEGAQRIKGYTADGILGQHFSIFYPPDQLRARRPQRILKIAEEEGRYQEDGWRVRSDGTLFWASVTITAIRDETGELLGFGKVVRDLTDRRRIEETLRQSEERFRLMVDSVRDYAIFMLDPSGRVATWNSGAQRLKGWHSDEIVGRHFSVFYPEADKGKCARELDGAARDGRYEDEGWRLRKDGSRFWANVIISAVRSPAGDLIGFTKVTRDLTERRATEERLRASLLATERLNQDLEDYASFVSHDLQEPLRKMAGFAELLQAKLGPDIPPEAADYVGRIVDGARRMRTLIIDVLDYARIGRHELQLDSVELEKAVAGALKNLERASAEAGAQIDVEPLPRVRGDLGLLTRLFQNLLGNAFKYSDPARPCRVRVRAEPKGDDWVVSVADNGIGFAGADARAIMRPFKRLHTRDKIPGTGLGLASAKRIAELHHGTLWAESGAGQGATFLVVLPGAETAR